MKYVLILSILISSQSCKSFNAEIRLQGKGCDDIEDSKNAVLVNTSSSESYRFTVQRKNEDAESSNTTTVPLGPGEESYIGCTSFYAETEPTPIPAPTAESMSDTSSIPNSSKPPVVRIKYTIVGQMKIDKQKD